MPTHYADPLGADRRPGGRRDRDRQPDPHAPRAGDRGGRAQEADVLREAARAVADEVGDDAGGGRERPACSSRWDSCGGSTPATRPRSSRSRRAASARRWSSSRPRAIRSGPSLEYANPKSSGGMLSTWGSTTSTSRAGSWARCETVSTIGATIAYPELATVGDIDNAIASLDLRERHARRRRSEPQRHLRLRHLHRDARARRARCGSATCARRR